MLILRAKIALNAVICMILFIFSLIMESWLLRNVGFYRSFLQFYVISKSLWMENTSIACKSNEPGIINNLYSYSPNMRLGLLAQ